ncbi:MAG: EhaG family protein [Methanomicrobiales archaeon]|nr:EhaG family protein [Methanomicrobiales archaeon]
MWNLYSVGLLGVLVSAAIAFYALSRETDDLHRLLLIDLVEIPSLGIIAVLGTDLAEALVLPGLVVGIAELLALSQIYLLKEGFRGRPEHRLSIEVLEVGHAPAILAAFLVCYGIVLSGFTGGGIAGLGILFWFISRRMNEDISLIETAAGFSWAVWIIAFFVFMFLPQYWFLAVMGAGVGILFKVLAKMALIGGMWVAPHE